MTSRGKKRRDPTSESALVYSTAGRVRRVEVPSKSLDPARSQVRLWLDRRASSRVVTVVTGVAGGPDALAALARELKTACGTGGTAKDGVIEIQGDHRDGVETALRARGFRPKRSGG